MATVETTPMTAEEFYEWVHRPENRDRFFELDQGEIVETPPPGMRHGVICGNVSRILGNYAVKSGRGVVCTNDTGIIVENDPDTVRGPDVSFYASGVPVSQGYSTVPPLLVVEVMSPTDRMHQILRRIRQLLVLGVKAVWVIDPQTRNVSIHRSGRDVELLSEGQELSADDVLPGCTFPVTDLFWNVPQ